MSYSPRFSPKWKTRCGLPFLLASSLVLVTGCGVSDLATSDPAAAPRAGVPIGGSVHGGQQPVSGATITLWTNGTTGYGSAAKSIATTTTDASGSFQFPSTYTCSGGGFAYLTASGGNPGAGGGTNSAIKMLAVLAAPSQTRPLVENDACGTVQTNNPFVVINEVSTVAAIYGLAQFFNPTTESIGSSSTNAPVGLANAFNNIGYMMNIAAGAVNASYTPYGYAYPFPATNNYQITVTPEQQKIYLIADILAACVNSTGPASANCTTLFGAAVPPPTPATTTLGSLFTYPPATDTLQAAYYMAINPINATSAGVPNKVNTAALYGLAPAVMPFPSSSALPSDWTVALTFSSTAVCTDTSCPSYLLSAPTNLNISNEGDIVYLSNTSSTIQNINAMMPYGGQGLARYSASAPMIGLGLDSGTTAQTGSSASFHIYSGRATSTGGALGKPVLEFGYNSSFQPGGTSAAFVDQGAPTTGISGNSYAGDATNIYFPVVANGYVYGALNVAQSGTSFLASGPAVPLTAINNGHALTGLTAATVGNVGTDIKVDHASNVWVTAPAGNAVYSMSTTGTGNTPTSYTTGLYQPTAIAIDHANNAWVVNSAGGTPASGYIAEISSTGTVKADATANDGGINTPTALALDGAGNLWVASSGSGTTFTGQTVSELASINGEFTPLSPSVGFAHSYTGPGSIAVDQSGNVWVANTGGYASATVPGALTMLLGAAVPTGQPYAYAIKANTLASLP